MSIFYAHKILLHLPHNFTRGLSLCHSYCVRWPSAILTTEKKPTFQTHPKCQYLSRVKLVIAPLELPSLSHLPSWSYSWIINSCPLSFASQHCVPTMPALHKHKQTPRELSASWWFYQPILSATEFTANKYLWWSHQNMPAGVPGARELRGDGFVYWKPIRVLIQHQRSTAMRT